jgi:hypothetical protein
MAVVMPAIPAPTIITCMSSLLAKRLKTSFYLYERMFVRIAIEPARQAACSPERKTDWSADAGALAIEPLSDAFEKTEPKWTGLTNIAASSA